MLVAARGDHDLADGLNEVRPRRPEQLTLEDPQRVQGPEVSMKSGLEGRNNEAEASDE